MALDLGSSRFKLGVIDAAGQLIDVRITAAPALSGTGPIRESRAQDYLLAIEALLKPAVPGRRLPLGLVCQRSTFLIWNRHDGQPLTPVVSWQDRRADEWCATHAWLEPLLIRRTGLLLSPHYAGPKLAAMLGADPRLAARVQSGEALFGNLDAWLSWRWSNGTICQTDVTMAARTAMFDIGTGDWADDLLAAFDVPRAMLPEVVGSLQGNAVAVAGMELRGSIADQAAGVAAVTAPTETDCLINFGTGAFVMQPVEGADIRRPGYLTGPVLVSSDYPERFAIEGTVNGAGPAISSFGPGPTDLPVADMCPDAFMIPDQSGVGAPHWRADVGLTLSSSARRLTLPEQRLVCIEGLLFRIYEILLGLNDDALPDRLIVSGGLAREPAIAQGLAALLDRPIRLLDEPEATLLGAARLAGALSPYADPGFETITPGATGGYLAEKFARWRAWCTEIYRDQ